MKKINSALDLLIIILWSIFGVVFILFMYVCLNDCIPFYVIQKHYKMKVEYKEVSGWVNNYDCDSVSQGYAYKDGNKIQLPSTYVITFN